jgi:hypothetical protein
MTKTDPNLFNRVSDDHYRMIYDARTLPAARAVHAKVSFLLSMLPRFARLFEHPDETEKLKAESTEEREKWANFSAVLRQIAGYAQSTSDGFQPVDAGAIVRAFHETGPATLRAAEPPLRALLVRAELMLSGSSESTAEILQRIDRQNAAKGSATQSASPIAYGLLSVQWGNGATRREVLSRVLTHLKRRTPFNATIHDLGRPDPVPGTKKDLRLVFAGNPAIVRIVDEDGAVSVDGTLNVHVGRAATDAEAIAARNWIALRKGHTLDRHSVKKKPGKLGGRLGRFSTCDLASLVEQVDKVTQPKAKGDVLEALTCRLIQTVSGLMLKRHGPVKTRTEEIDIVVKNECRNNPLRPSHTGPLLLFECKNWSKKCGKDEVVCFEDKLRNRRGQCNVGFLVSWNGFTRGATDHLLRKSDSKLVIGLIDGRMIKSAAAETTFFEVLVKAWDKTVLS